MILDLIGGGFQHAYSSTEWKKPKHFSWSYNTDTHPVQVFVDDGIWNNVRYDKKGTLWIGWLLESRFISKKYENYILENINFIKERFDFILTHNDRLIERDPAFFKWCPAYGTYIKDIQIYPKSKPISMIASDKQMTEQQVLRYNIAKKLQPHLDLYGRGFKEIKEKEEGLKDYMFSICIENDTYPTYFTEKILDCFATGTVPIYMGHTNVCKHFNEKGILFLEKRIDLSQFTYDYYVSMMPYIEDNLQRVKQFDVLDDWIYLTYIKPLL